MNNISDVLDDKVKNLFKDKPFPTTPPPHADDEKVDSAKNTDDAISQPVTDEKTEQTTNKPEVNLEEVKKSILRIKDQLDSLLRMVQGEQILKAVSSRPEATVLDGGERIVEGVFTGDKMMGEDGEEYSVPPNYASKSKLVEGDMMKLTITHRGSFIYKQIQQVPRKRVTGELVSDEAGTWSVLYEGRPYKILTASATFYKGSAGDDAVILIPESGESSWGAVENIIHKS